MNSFLYRNLKKKPFCYFHYLSLKEHFQTEVEKAFSLKKMKIFNEKHSKTSYQLRFLLLDSLPPSACHILNFYYPNYVECNSL